MFIGFLRCLKGYKSKGKNNFFFKYFVIVLTKSENVAWFVLGVSLDSINSFADSHITLVRKRRKRIDEDENWCSFCSCHSLAAGSCSKLVVRQYWRCYLQAQWENKGRKASSKKMQQREWFWVLQKGKVLPHIQVFSTCVSPHKGNSNTE